MYDIDDRELAAIEGGGVCIDFLGGCVRSVAEGDGCFGIRIY